MASNSTEHVGSDAKHVRIKVKRGGNVVLDWYALDVGQGELTFAQLYERLVAASEFQTYNFKQVLSRSATVHFFCNDEKIGRGIEVYSGLQVGQATKQFGCFIRMEVDKTGATTEAPRPKSVFELANFIEQSLADSDQVQREDTRVCEGVQRGMESTALDVGRYAPGPEMPVHAFHLQLARDLRAGLESTYSTT